MRHTTNLENLSRFSSNPKVLLVCCGVIQLPFILSQPQSCFPPPFFEMYPSFAIGLFLAAYGISQNTVSGNTAAALLSGLLFYTHFYSIPVRMMEISQKGAGEIWSELIRFWLDRLNYDPIYGLQLSFAVLLFCVALFCLAHKLFYKRLAST